MVWGASGGCSCGSGPARAVSREILAPGHMQHNVFHMTDVQSFGISKRVLQVNKGIEIWCCRSRQLQHLIYG